MGYGKWLNSVEYVGNIYESESCGKFRVVRELIPVGFDWANGKKTRRFEIEFLDTGYRTTVSRSSLYQCKAKDKLLPTVYGVACMGQEENIFDFNSTYYEKTIHKVWECMIARCYYPKSDQYCNYGALGVRVSDEWLSFRNFERDVSRMTNYDRKLLEPSMFHLDKDYLQLHLPISQRVYSKETCLWISMYENLLINGLENGKIKYFGVIYNDGFYFTRIYHNEYGRFKTPEEAACFFNYIYPLVCIKEYSTIPIFNNVQMIPFEEILDRNLIINGKYLNQVFENYPNIKYRYQFNDYPYMGVELK